MRRDTPIRAAIGSSAAMLHRQRYRLINLSLSLRIRCAIARGPRNENRSVVGGVVDCASSARRVRRLLDVEAESRVGVGAIKFGFDFAA